MKAVFTSMTIIYGDVWPVSTAVIVLSLLYSSASHNLLFMIGGLPSPLFVLQIRQQIPTTPFQLTDRAETPGRSLPSSSSSDLLTSV